MADEAEKELHEIFENAGNFVKTVAGRLKNEELLYLYARFKQANEGPCNIPRPGLFDFSGKQKWDAWKKLGDKSRKDAMLEYINMLTSIDPEWDEKMETGKVKAKSGMGVAVSTMHNSDEFITDDCKTIFDWCKEGNVNEVTRHLKTSDKIDINVLDEDGLALMHWACDRGFKDLVDVLLNHGASINVQDCDGQTPLHYGKAGGRLLQNKMDLLTLQNMRILRAFGSRASTSDTRSRCHSDGLGRHERHRQY